jgi:hypothetical protein
MPSAQTHRREEFREIVLGGTDEGRSTTRLAPSHLSHIPPFLTRSLVCVCARACVRVRVRVCVCALCVRVLSRVRNGVRGPQSGQGSVRAPGPGLLAQLVCVYVCVCVCVCV